jgi:hypothetical protein
LRVEPCFLISHDAYDTVKNEIVTGKKCERVKLRGALKNEVANTWPKITARYGYAMVRNGKEQENLDFS